MTTSICKSHPLREIITEKLSTAASEILAAVEKTVAVYEAEAADLRQEINRQEKLLQLLQPRVKSEPTDIPLFSLSAAGGDEGLKEGLPQTSDIEIKNPLILDVLPYGKGTEEEGINSSVSSVPSAVHTDDFNRSHIRSLENFLDLKICILKDWSIEAVSDQVDDEYPVHELQCHSGLQEADFLQLLRSTFPQLAVDTPFEAFIADATKRLQPLKVGCFTPEQICRAAGNSALYVRLKRPAEEEAGRQEQHIQIDSYDEDNCDDEDSSFIQLPSTSDSRNEAPPLPPSPQKNPVNDRIRLDTISLSVRVLDSHGIEVVTKSVLRRCKPRRLRCPYGMQEADFLKLLRSTFPRLRSETPLEYFITNNTKKLLPLQLETFTPERISAAVGDSGLYIRLKRDGSVREKKLKVNQDVDRKGDREDSEGSAANRIAAENLNDQKPPSDEADGSINLRIHLLEDSRIESVTNEVLNKYRLHNLRCPPGMSCGDFLKLLRSTFPKLASKTYFETFKSSPDRKLLPLYVNIFTPEQIKIEAGESALFIRLKSPEEIPIRKRSSPDDGRPSSQNPTPPPAANKTPDREKMDDKDAPISLGICLLEGSNPDVLPPHALTKNRIHELKCPRGLKEKDFVDLLKSNFSQLAGGQAVKILTLHGSKLKPLKVTRLIPEEIQQATGSVDPQFCQPVLYIQLPKKPPQKEDPKPAAHPSASCPSIQNLSELKNMVKLKICILDDPKIEVISPLVLQKHPILEFQCLNTLQEQEFHNALMSRFPQLAGEYLEFLVDYGPYMKSMNLKNAMVEKICTILKSARTSVLYIRRTERPKVPPSVKRSHSDVSDQSVSTPGQSLKKRRKMKVKSRQSASHRRDGESENDKTEDSEDEDEPGGQKPAKRLGLESMVSQISSANHKSPKTEENRPVAVETIQIDDDQTDDSEDEKYPYNPKPSRLSLMNKQISAHISKETIKVGKKPSTAKVSSQVDDDETEDSEDYDDLQSVESSRLHTSNLGDEAKSNAAKGKSNVSVNKEVRHPKAKSNPNTDEVEILDSEEGEDDNDSSRRSSLLSQISGQDVKQNCSTQTVNNKPKNEAVKMNAPLEQLEISDSDNEDSVSMATTVDLTKNKDLNQSDGKAKRKSSQSGMNGKKHHFCKVCSLIHQSKGLLIKHAWQHVGHLDRRCGVCGIQLDSTVELQKHLQKHQKTHSCKICSKHFIYKMGYQRHMERHTGNNSQDQQPKPTQQ